MTTTVTTKLEAINVMLTAIGESPVNTITSSTTTDVSIAIQILDNVSREVQSVGGILIILTLIIYLLKIHLIKLYYLQIV